MLEEKQTLGALSIPLDPSLALAANDNDHNNNTNNNKTTTTNNNDVVSISGSAAGSVASLASVFKSRYVQ